MMLPPARIARISRPVLAAIVPGLCICSPNIVLGVSPGLAGAGGFFLPGRGQAGSCAPLPYVKREGQARRPWNALK